jgi:hypothetical protein
MIRVYTELFLGVNMEWYIIIFCSKIFLTEILQPSHITKYFYKFKQVNESIVCQCVCP